MDLFEWIPQSEQMPDSDKRFEDRPYLTHQVFYLEYTPVGKELIRSKHFQTLGDAIKEAKDIMNKNRCSISIRSGLVKEPIMLSCESV